MRWITVCSIHDLSLTIVFVMNFDLDCSQAVIGFLYLSSSPINYSKTQIVLSIKFYSIPEAAPFQHAIRKHEEL